MDTWILMRNSPGRGGDRQLTIIKSRGMAHATDERRFRITNEGLAADDARDVEPSATATRKN
jgi:hypothetical protein